MQTSTSTVAAIIQQSDDEPTEINNSIAVPSRVWNEERSSDIQQNQQSDANSNVSENEYVIYCFAFTLQVLYFTAEPSCNSHFTTNQ